MKKRVLALVMSTAMIASVLTACGGNSGSNSSGTNDTSSSSGTSSNTSSDSSGGSAEITDYGSGEIVVWVADAVTDFTSQQLESFKEANPQYAGYTIRVESVGEGDAATNMITDVEAGADIYAFPQDQLARLVAAGAIMPITGDYASFVNAQNDAGAAAAATVGGMVYAFPITSDNGYFMYYDKSVISDPSSLDAIISDCEAAGKNFYFEINSGWYAPAFFFGAGCTLTYDSDDSGNFTACNTDYASDKGVAALKAIINLKKSSAFQNGSSANTATNYAAIVDGTWDKETIMSVLGDNYACAKLPSFTVDGKSYQMSGFGGFKLIGVKPQTEANKLQVCLAMAQFLSSEETQLARFDLVGWGPSNLAAQQSDAVKADEALSALAEQLAYTIPQGQYPNEYWDLAVSLGDSVISGDYDNATDDELMSVLESFQTTCQSYAQ